MSNQWCTTGGSRHPHGAVDDASSTQPVRLLATLRHRSHAHPGAPRCLDEYRSAIPRLPLAPGLPGPRQNAGAPGGCRRPLWHDTGDHHGHTPAAPRPAIDRPVAVVVGVSRNWLGHRREPTRLTQSWSPPAYHVTVLLAPSASLDGFIRGHAPLRHRLQFRRHRRAKWRHTSDQSSDCDRTGDTHGRQSTRLGAPPHLTDDPADVSRGLPG